MSLRRLVGALLVAALIGPAAAAGAAPKAIPRPTALEWGGRYFVDRGAFVQWLEARHGNFARWSRRHPDALRTLVGATAVPAPLQSIGGGAQSGPKTEAAPAGGVSAAGATGASGVEVAFAVVGLLLFAFSLVPAQFIVGRLSWAERLSRQRWLFAGAGVSILVTLALTRSLG